MRVSYDALMAVKKDSMRKMLKLHFFLHKNYLHTYVASYKFIIFSFSPL